MNTCFPKRMFVSLLVLFLLSCSSKSNKITDITSIDFLDISKVSTDKNNNSKVVDVYVVNKTSDCVVFRYDLGTEIFLKVNGEWVKVKNLIEFASNEDVVLTASSGLEPDTVIFINPDYSMVSGDSSDIRIVLHAYLCDNGKPVNYLSSDSIEIPLE